MQYPGLLGRVARSSRTQCCGQGLCHYFSDLGVRCRRIRAQRGQYVLHSVRNFGERPGGPGYRRKSLMVSSLVKSTAGNSRQYFRRERNGGPGIPLYLPARLPLMTREPVSECKISHDPITACRPTRNPKSLDHPPHLPAAKEPGAPPPVSMDDPPLTPGSGVEKFRRYGSSSKPR